MKQFILTGFALLGLSLGGLFLAAGSMVYAAPSQDAAEKEVCEGIGGRIVDGKCETGGTDLNTVVRAALNLLSTIIGIVAVVMIIVGGFKYITSGGDSGNIQSAKSTIIYAVVGLVIVAFAQFIVQFVLKETTEVPKAETQSVLEPTPRSVL